MLLHFSSSGAQIHNKYQILFDQSLLHKYNIIVSNSHEMAICFSFPTLRKRNKNNNHACLSYFIYYKAKSNTFTVLSMYTSLFSGGRKGSGETTKQRVTRSLFYLFIPHFFFRRKKRLWRDCANAQSCLSLGCLYKKPCFKI